MTDFVRCTNCGQPPEANLSRPNYYDTQDRRRPRRKEKPPPKYKPETYEPLTRHRGYIRVLRLLPNSVENRSVDCDLVVYSFSKDHEVEQPYEAMSWCWGTAKPTAYINIHKDGKVYAKYVPPELLTALKALRLPKVARYLWIDAICINQDNALEKNHQVEMMSEIYGRAKRVCVWLGDGDESSQLALRFIRKEVLQLQNFDELCESERASRKWSALLDLMQRPWFSRRWVVQEISLARRAVVYCGTDKISWRKFAVAVELFVEVETATHRLSEVMKKDPNFYHVPGWFEYVSALGASLLVEATGKLFRDYKLNERSEMDVESDDEPDSEPDSDTDSVATSAADSDTASSPEVAVSKDKPFIFNKGQPLLTLEYLVSSLSIFNVTEAQDSVYALLAIAKDTIPYASDEDSQLVADYTQEALSDFTQKKRYKVDYEQPYSDICKEFVEFCIGQSERSRALDIICRPWAPEAPKASSKRQGRDSEGVPNATESASSKNGKQTTDDKNPTEGESLPKSKEDAKKISNPVRRKKVEDPIALPSWIPQLSGAAYAMLPQAGVHTLRMGRKNADTLVGLPSSSQSLQRNYNAAETKSIDSKTFHFQKRVNMQHHSMYVKGFILDSISKGFASSQGGAIPSEWAAAAGWRKVALEDPPPEFWRTLVADRGRDGRNPPIYYSRACRESFNKGGFSSGSVNTTDLINNERCSVVAQFCRRVQAVIWNRRLIKTESLRLGLASQYTEKGDLVCILYGCSVPVVLRRKWKTVAEVEEEIEEDVRLSRERYIVARRNFSRYIMTSKKKKEDMRRRCAIWDEKLCAQWRKDDAWHTKWKQIVSERKEAQLISEAEDKEGLTWRIRKGEEKMGYFLQMPKDKDGELKGTDETYRDRLERKSYLVWLQGKRSEKPENDKMWDEPHLRWREFRIMFLYGRFWKAYWLEKKERPLDKGLKRARASMKRKQEQAVLGQQRREIALKKQLQENEKLTNGVQVHNEAAEGTKKENKAGEKGAKNEKGDGAKKEKRLPPKKARYTYPVNSDYDVRFTAALRKKIRAKFMEKPKDSRGSSQAQKKAAEACEQLQVLKAPDPITDPHDNEEVMRLKQNWSYYELLGECYEHGMMNGEAMAYQDEQNLRAQVFEIR